jgi:subtilisin family serine protease
MIDELVIPESPSTFPTEEVENAILYSGDLFWARRIVSIGISLLLIVSIYWLISYVDDEGIFSLRPSDKAMNYQDTYGDMIQLDEVSLDGQGVSVCIVDSGIDLTHPDLSGLSLAGWRDFISTGTEPYDDNGHGTSMAGILVADGWIEGVAPNVDLYVAKALDGVNGEGSDETVAQAIDWCVEQNVNIISLSLGGAPGILPFNPFSGRDSGDAANDAIEQGIIVVAAAGNDGGGDDDGDVAHPSSEQLVISVGGVTLSESHWSGSSIGDNDGSLFPLILPRQDPNKKPEIVAPAESVPVINNQNSWSIVDGTSAATVFVTGAIALLLENSPELSSNNEQANSDTVAQIKQLILNSVKTKEGQEGHDDNYGYGLLQIDNLIIASRSV